MKSKSRKPAKVSRGKKKKSAASRSKSPSKSMARATDLKKVGSLELLCSYIIGTIRDLKLRSPGARRLQDMATQVKAGAS